MEKRFVMPPRVGQIGEQYVQGFATYTEYNYLAPNLSSRIKRRHFDIALEITAEDFHRGAVLDYGCADGVFLPSLSRYFPIVAGVDVHRPFVKQAEQVVTSADLANARILCSEGLSHGEVAAILGRRFDIIYLLEVMEHIGDRNRMYESKVEFLKSLKPLMTPDAKLVVSVPKMAGPTFLLQRLGLWGLRLEREKLSWGELFRAGLLGDTRTLERRWQTFSHLGFNQYVFHRYLKKGFNVLRVWNDLFQVVYLLQ